MNMQVSVIEALKGDVGIVDGNYDSKTLSRVVRGQMDRIVIPAMQKTDFVDFMGTPSDTREFFERCIAQGRSGILLMRQCAVGESAQMYPIVPAMIQRLCSGDPATFAGAPACIEGLQLFSGNLVKYLDMMYAWHHKQMTVYVGEFWNRVRKDREAIIEKASTMIGPAKELVGLKEWDFQQESNLGGLIVNSEFHKTMIDAAKFCELDPNYPLWAKIDGFVRYDRAQTSTIGTSSERIRLITRIGTGAGVDFAIGCLQTAIIKCQGDKRGGLGLYRNSVRELFTVPGMLDINFISSIAELLRHPEVVTELVEALKLKKYGNMYQIVATAKQKRVDFMTSAIRAGQSAGTNGAGTQARLLIEHDCKYPFHPDFFELTSDMKLQISPWFYDFVRLVLARDYADRHNTVPTKGCPMAHGRTGNETDDSVLFIEDFAILVGEIMERYWRIK